MKKALLFLFVSSLSFAQDMELLSKFKTSDSLDISKIAETVFEDFKILPKTKSQIESKFDTNLYTYVLKKNPTQKEIEDYVNGNGCKDCVSLKFHYAYEGGNRHLNIPGTKYYTFDYAVGTFLTIFPFWQKHIEPNATTSVTWKESPYYTYENDLLKLILRPERDSKFWIIKNEIKARD